MATLKVWQRSPDACYSSPAFFHLPWGDIILLERVIFFCHEIYVGGIAHTPDSHVMSFVIVLCQISCHCMTVVNCVAVDEHRIVTGSSDCLLKSWSILSGRCTFDFVGHKAEVVSTNDVTRLSFKIVNIYYFNLLVFKQSHVIVFGRSQYCVVMNKECVASGSSDSTVRIWSLKGRFHRIPPHFVTK